MLIQAPKTGFVGNYVVEVITGLGLCWQLAAVEAIGSLFDVPAISPRMVWPDRK